MKNHRGPNSPVTIKFKIFVRISEDLVELRQSINGEPSTPDFSVSATFLGF